MKIAAAILTIVLLVGYALVFSGSDVESFSPQVIADNEQRSPKRFLGPSEQVPAEAMRTPVIDESEASDDPTNELDATPEPARSTQVTPILTDDEAQDIRSNLDLLYANADREQLVNGYRQAMQSLPQSFANAAHNGKLDNGDYVALRTASEGGGPSGTLQVPTEAQGSEQAFGLVRVHKLPDGTVVKTEVSLEELGQDAALAVEIAWFQSAIGRHGRAKR